MGAHRPSIDFWFEFASTYSYLAAMRIEAAALAAAVEVRWRPFLLGPIFKAQGWNTSPFNLYPAKGRYMWRDLERLASAQGIAFVRPQPFPQMSLLAARAALSEAVAPRRPEFSRGVFTAEFADGRDIAQPSIIGEIASGLGLDPAAVLAQAGSAEIKERLKTETAEAERLGIFGAPSFVTADGELFWGHDRLDQALAWAAGLAKLGGSLNAAG